MFARVAIAIPVGVGVTAGLLFLMQGFIASGRGELREPAAHVVDFVRIERLETILEREERADKPAAAVPQPDMPSPEFMADGFGVIEVAFAAPDIRIGADITGVGIGVSDGEYLPIVKVAPVYPVRALQRRLEGFVIVEFIVTSSGAVRDVVVVESTEKVFEDAAVEAALKFKYRPRVIDGEPVEVTGVRNKISFRLQA